MFGFWKKRDTAPNEPTSTSAAPPRPYGERYQPVPQQVMSEGSPVQPAPQAPANPTGGDTRCTICDAPVQRMSAAFCGWCARTICIGCAAKCVDQSGRSKCGACGGGVMDPGPTALSVAAEAPAPDETVVLPISQAAPNRPPAVAPGVNVTPSQSLAESAKQFNRPRPDAAAVGPPAQRQPIAPVAPSAMDPLQSSTGSSSGGPPDYRLLPSLVPPSPTVAPPAPQQPATPPMPEQSVIRSSPTDPLSPSSEYPTAKVQMMDGSWMHIVLEERKLQQFNVRVGDCVCVYAGDTEHIAVIKGLSVQGRIVCHRVGDPYCTFVPDACVPTLVTLPPDAAGPGPHHNPPKPIDGGREPATQQRPPHATAFPQPPPASATPTENQPGTQGSPMMSPVYRQQPEIRFVENNQPPARGGPPVPPSCSAADIPPQPDVDVRYLTMKDVRVLGQGAQGVVWQCITSDGEHLVRKEMLFADCDYDAFVARRDFAKRIMTLSQPHLIRYLAVIATEQPLKINIVMPFYNESDLTTMIGRHLQSRSPIPELKLCSIILQIATALSYLHSQSPPITHRDVKPDNVLLFENGERTLLMDLDVSRNVDLGETAQSMTHGVGTQEYMAPEAVQGRAGLSSDVWSLGVVFFMMASLADSPLLVHDGSLTLLNHTGWDPVALTRSVYDAIQRHNPSMSTGTIGVINSMLIHAVENRPTMHQVVDSLHTVMENLLLSGSM